MSTWNVGDNVAYLHLKIIDILGYRNSYKKTKWYNIKKIERYYKYVNELSKLQKFILKDGDSYELLYGLLSVQWALRDSIYQNDKVCIEKVNQLQFTYISIHDVEDDIIMTVGPIENTTMNKHISATVVYTNNKTNCSYTIDVNNRKVDSDIKKYVDLRIREAIYGFSMSLINDD